MEESNKIIRKNIFENILIAIAIMLYFIVINFSYIRLEEKMLLNGLKLASLIVLFISIILFEIAYHKDSGKIAINGIEMLVLAIHSLTIWNVVNKIDISFQTYILSSTYAFAIYYVLKSMLIYTREKRKYLKGLSDIHEIVSKDPVKKEARKRKNEENI